MPFVSDQAVTDLKDAVQAGATVVESIIAFVNGVPKLISDAVAAAKSDGTDVSDAVEQAVASIKSQASNLTTAIATTPNGNEAAPVGNLPA